MSPKYRLRPASGVFRDARHKEKRGHTIFLPLAMLMVIGGTYLVVSITQPLSEVTGPPRELSLRERSYPPVPDHPEKIVLLDFSCDLLKTAETLPVAAVVADKFVSHEKLFLPEPLPDLSKAIPVANSEFAMESSPLPGPETDLEEFRSGLPRPKVIPVAAPAIPAERIPVCENVPAKICREESVIDFSKLRDHELLPTLPGKTERLRVGDFLDNPSKAREIGQDFNRKLEEGKKSGFRLVQSQVFVDSGQVPRFQAVWHRM